MQQTYWYLTIQMPINVWFLTQSSAYKFGCDKNHQLDYKSTLTREPNIFYYHTCTWACTINQLTWCNEVNEETWRCQLFFSSFSVSPAEIFRQIDQTVLKIILPCRSAQCYNRIEQRDTGQLIQDDPNQRAGLLIQQTLSKCMNTLFIYSE